MVIRSRWWYDHDGDTVTMVITVKIAWSYWFGRILTQIKLKLSPLRSHLFNYNLTDNPFCPACKDSIETPSHFFTECIAYSLHRIPMLTNLLKLNPQISSPSEFLDFIVNGSETGSHDHRVQINKSIFRHVTIFMFKTKRFMTTDFKWIITKHLLYCLISYCLML